MRPRLITLLALALALVAAPGCHHKKGGYLRPTPASIR